MEIVDSNFNIFFSPIFNIRESIFILEKELSDFFPKPFNLIPLPNEAPLEIPRITATSHHGFSNLNISLNSVQFSTSFNESYSNDWTKCIDYVYQHVSKINKILKPQFNSKALYCGLTLNFTKKVDSLNSIDLILKNFIKSSSSLKPYDLVSKQTYLIDSMYYLNLQVQNQRILKNQNVQIGHLRENERSDIIGISLDINDRYGSNYTPGYVSGETEMERVFSLSNEIVTKKLERFIREGEIDL